MEEIKLTIKPLEDMVIVKEIKEEKSTASGIVIQQDKRMHNVGVVLAKGDGKNTEHGKLGMDIEVGDTVYWRGGGDTIQDGLDEYTLIRYDSILYKKA